ncbi:DUF3862 domain-containing protein [Sphingomonas ursincola]|uniref:DUF3862 domain-containing protein n=1 Tax=Sphingomonas ursincola TaxID=56361 RepID=UPI0023567F5F|nr:DUF3862 domain-containing protein [Sphingomonas ursincola]MBY0621686.1 DUF3862 domain-containing protein [Sphingomonas ursincola]
MKDWKQLGLAIGLLALVIVYARWVKPSRLSEAEAVPESILDNSQPAPNLQDVAVPHLAGISKSEFDSIRIGMTHQQVADIVGSPGEIMSESAYGGTRIVLVQWEGETGLAAAANAMFENGRLFQKTQYGLR